PRISTNSSPSATGSSCCAVGASRANSRLNRSGPNSSGRAWSEPMMRRDLDLALIGPVRLAFRRRAPRAIVIAAIALAAFALVLVIDGKDPVRAYRDTLLYVFGNAYGFSELMVRMTPLLMTSLAVALPSRVGLINVGGEGQLYMGAWLATAGALSFPNLPSWLLLPLMRSEEHTSELQSR